MTGADTKAFAEALLVLGETFNEPVSDVRIEAYFDALRDLDAELVLSLMHRSVRESKFFPRPAEIREMATGSHTDRAERAWSNILKEIRRVGWCGTPQLDAAELDAVIAMWGGWVQLCETLPAEGPELLGYRKAFLASYGSCERLAAVEGPRELTAAARGIIEAAKAGHPWLQ